MNIPDKMFINGKWVDSRSAQRIPDVNPSTEEIITGVPRGNADDIDSAVSAAQSAYECAWSEITPAERGRMIYRLAEAILAARQELAELETMDVGKPLRDSLGDINGVAETLKYNAGAADKLQGDTIPLGNQFVDFTWLEPLGVTAHIVPWNFPLGMAIRSIAPALAAGCTVVLKPAEESPLSALKMAEIAQNVGFPDGVINVVTGFGEEAGAALTRHPGVRGITFTGSVETGREIMKAAAQGIKPVVLELGGKNPMIVFQDADLERALDDAVDGGFGNCGQVCSSVSRLILHKSIKKDFLQALAKKARALSVGPGMNNPDLGPLVSYDQYNRVTGYIETGIQEGAKLVSGGKRPDNLKKGFFIQPTVFERVDTEMNIVQKEIFGPVIVGLQFEDEEEAIEIANGVSYGLVAGVYTRDISRALRLARRLKTGSVWINGWYLGGVQAPTGGTKDSGFGRERGLAGIFNYCQIKNVGIRL
jgi:aldehyde dehydrogenase (NAD+)